MSRKPLLDRKGDPIHSFPTSKKYKDNFDKIFKKEPENDRVNDDTDTAQPSKSKSYITRINGKLVD